MKSKRELAREQARKREQWTLHYYGDWEGSGYYLTHGRYSYLNSGQVGLENAEGSKLEAAGLKPNKRWSCQRIEALLGRKLNG